MTKPDVNTLNWRIRRGMWELDILLENFLKQQYPTLSAQDKQLFEALLALEDTQLFAWLVQGDTCPDAKFIHLGKMIVSTSGQ